MQRWALFSAAFVSACAPVAPIEPQPSPGCYDVTLDETFGGVESASVRKGAAMMEWLVTGTRFSFEPSGCDRSVVVLRMLETDPAIMSIEEEAGAGIHGAFGYVGEQPTVLLVVDKMHTESRLTNVAAHEFGHALGLDHDSPLLVMQPSGMW